MTWLKIGRKTHVESVETKLMQIEPEIAKYVVRLSILSTGKPFRFESFKPKLPDSGRRYVRADSNENYGSYRIVILQVPA